jgi:hypothetical protein
MRFKVQGSGFKVPGFKGSRFRGSKNARTREP